MNTDQKEPIVVEPVEQDETAPEGQTADVGASAEDNSTVVELDNRAPEEKALDAEEATEDSGGEGEDNEEGEGEEKVDEKKKKSRKWLVLLVGAAVVVIVIVGIVAAVSSERPVATEDSQAKTAAEQAKIPEAKTPLAQKPDADKDETSEPGDGAEELPAEADKPASGTSSGGTGSNTGTGTGTGTGTAAGAGGGSGGSGGSNKTWHEGWNEWVVDVAGHNERQLVRAAWDEETGHYGTRCKTCKLDIGGNAAEHILATGHAGYISNYWFVDGSIHHDAVYKDVWIAEQGHNVWHDGYWE